MYAMRAFPDEAHPVDGRVLALGDDLRPRGALGLCGVDLEDVVVRRAFIGLDVEPVVERPDVVLVRLPDGEVRPRLRQLVPPRS